MAESFKPGDLVEVISTDPGSLIRVGDRGTVIASGDLRVAVDYGIGEPVMSLKCSIRKIPPPQDWVKLCHLGVVKQKEPVHV